MSQIDQVLALARSLQLAGKQPSIALLKAKLKSVPMPVLIQGLQRFKSLSAEELAALVPQVPMQPNAAAEQNEEQSELVQLREQVKKLESAYNELAQRVAELERNH
ncbi:hypothetical protein L2750_04185 [Shewanella submarina]|uniref:KfrA N-terminal DNA-binding domain-containing protein n=1 Tax=Shewanella submarina TaxID=2016376 RepID=A0ABV7GKF8_9GAMM|nr:hypothetical protein [Shewanella submarina]MCL1036347.1 hypothetical protein [Shewanella submarina]